VILTTDWRGIATPIRTDIRALISAWKQKKIASHDVHPPTHTPIELLGVGGISQKKLGDLGFQDFFTYFWVYFGAFLGFYKRNAFISRDGV